MELRNRVESLYLKQETITNLLTILDSHFQKKDYENITLDLYSKKYLWKEYSSLLYQIILDADDIKRELKNIIESLYKKVEDKYDN